MCEIIWITGILSVTNQQIRHDNNTIKRTHFASDERKRTIAHWDLITKRKYFDHVTCNLCYCTPVVVLIHSTRKMRVKIASQWRTYVHIPFKCFEILQTLKPFRVTIILQKKEKTSDTLSSFYWLIFSCLHLPYYTLKWALLNQDSTNWRKIHLSKECDWPTSFLFFCGNISLFHLTGYSHAFSDQTECSLFQ